MGVDPLTTEWWHDLQSFDCDCDCPANGRPEVKHTEECSITPEFAKTVTIVGSPEESSFVITLAHVNRRYWRSSDKRRL